MTINDLIDRIENLQGNLARGNGVYVSSRNMDRFANLLSEIDGRHGILLTPYLIIDKGALYELHYYEFDIEVRNEQSHFNDYNPRNSLPKEITENLRPQAIVAVGDTDFYQKAVMWYLKNMQKMTFNEIKTYYPELQNAQVFYQIFMDSDLQ